MKDNKTLNTLLIQELYKKYQSVHEIFLPKLKDIKYVNTNDFWAQFKSKDLYNNWRVKVLFVALYIVLF